MEKILLYSLVSLGDAIMATSVIPILRQAWPGARISMMVKGLNAPVVEDNPQVDDSIVYTYQTKSLGWKSLWPLLKNLRARGFNLSFSLDRHKRASLIGLFANIPVRVGPAHIFDYSPSWAPRFYTHVLEPNLDLDRDSRLEAMQDIVRQYTGLKEARGRPSFGRPGPENTALARRLLASLPPSRYRVGLALQSNLPIRSWAKERTAELIDLLAEKEDAACFIIGTAQQRDFAEAVNAKSRRKAANFCGLTPSLKDLAALMLAAHGFVGLDTGSSHLAAAIGAPLVTLMGSSAPRQYRPVSCSEEAEAWNLHLWSGRPCSPCRYWNPEECPHQMACMYDHTAAEVAASLKKLFGLAEAGLTPAAGKPPAGAMRPVD